jgi:hypothetical protein
MTDAQRERLGRLIEAAYDCIDAGLDGEELVQAISYAMRRIGKPKRRATR